MGCAPGCFYILCPLGGRQHMLMNTAPWASRAGAITSICYTALLFSCQVGLAVMTACHDYILPVSTFVHNYILLLLSHAHNRTSPIIEHVRRPYSCACKSPRLSWTWPSSCPWQTFLAAPAAGVGHQGRKHEG
eukprot:scaffold136247_cov21-Tisochrysis_lutea.AAC.1